MMGEIGFNIAVYAVPVVPGPDGDQAAPGAYERLLRLGDAPTEYLPPPPRLTAATIDKIGRSWPPR